MRIRLEFDDVVKGCLDSTRTWYFVDLANIGTISDLQYALVREFDLCHPAESLELELKGFSIPRKLNVSSIIKENDLIKVKCTNRYLKFWVTDARRKKVKKTDWELDSSGINNSKKTKSEDLQNKSIRPSERDQKEYDTQKKLEKSKPKAQPREIENAAESDQLHPPLPELSAGLSELSERVKSSKSRKVSKSSELSVSSSDSSSSYESSSDSSSSSESSSDSSSSSESSSDSSSSSESSSKSSSKSEPLPSKPLETSSSKSPKKKSELPTVTEPFLSSPYESSKIKSPLTSPNVSSFRPSSCASSSSIEKPSKDTSSTSVQFEHLVFDDDGLPHTVPFKNKTGPVAMGRCATSSKKKRSRNLKQKIDLPEGDNLINTSRIYVTSSEQDDKSIPTDYTKFEKADLKTLAVGDFVACTFNCLTPNLTPGVSPWRRGYVLSKSDNMDVITLDLLPCENVNELYWFDDEQKPIKSIYDWATEWGVEVSIGKTDISVDRIADIRIISTEGVTK